MAQNPRSGKITKRLVDALTSEDARFTLWDAQLKGFGVRVAVSDTKTYVVRYRTIGGADRLLHIARHGVVTAEEARERAAAVLAEVASGGDPHRTKVERREELTMSELCDLYMKEGVTMKKATTLRIDRIRIARHIKPRLGGMKVTDIGRADIERLMADVGSGRIRGEATPHTRGGIHAASRTVGLLGGIFTFAVERDFVKTNPTRGVKRYKDNRRNRFLSPAELARLGEVLAEIEDHGGDPRHINIIRLLALTGARKNEIVKLKWSEIDRATGVLRLEDSKTGAKVIRLGSAALKLIEGLLSNGSIYVFPDRKNPQRPIANLDWAWVRIRKRAGMEDLRIHDLRHSFASAGLAGGEGLYLIGKLLGHSHVSTTSRYAHLADDPVRAAADRISESVAASLASRPAEERQAAH
ncbi:MAG TPA: integrase [Brevundimonas sp.]|nr:integrase [Brevundimonas sp.]